MSGNRISTNMTDLKNLGIDVEQKGNDYINEIKSIYELIEQLDSEWKGQDASDYVRRIRDSRPYLESLGQIICNYGSFLQQTSNAYTKVQEENISAIKKGGVSNV